MLKCAKSQGSTSNVERRALSVEHVTVSEDLPLRESRPGENSKLRAIPEKENQNDILPTSPVDWDGMYVAGSKQERDVKVV
jgi:hypothetical protein